MTKKKTSTEILAEVTVFMKYAKYSAKLQRREAWEEICYRNRDMHLSKYPELTAEILNLYNNFVIPNLFGVKFFTYSGTDRCN